MDKKVEQNERPGEEDGVCCYSYTEKQQAALLGSNLSTDHGDESGCGRQC